MCRGSFCGGRLLNHSAGAFQGTAPVFFSGDDADDADEGGEGGVFAGDDAGGKDLLRAVGLGGTVLIKDLKERTGRSIPSSDNDESAWLNGDRIWLRRVRGMPRELRAVERRKD